MTYSWNFGDGSPVVAGIGATHTYTNGGTYTITITITATGSGCTNTASAIVSVAPTTVNCSTATTSMINNLTYNLYVGVASMSPQPYMLSSTIGIENQWNFGDGSPLSAWVSSHVPHSYNAPGVYQIHLSTRWRDSITNNILCTKTDTASIAVLFQGSVSGMVRWDSAMVGPDTAQIWLIKFNAQTNLLEAVDSTISYGGSHAHFSFTNVPSGTYLTKAHLRNQVVGANGIVPTYRDSSLTWNGAQSFLHNGINTGSGTIYMRQGLVTLGPGFVGGSVLLGANKGTADGEPVANQLVLLRDAATASPIQFTYTSTTGAYSFSNLPLGSYRVYPEAMNYATTASAPVTISANNSSVNGILFKKDDVEMDIRQVTTGVRDVTLNTLLFKVVPNPTSGKFALTFPEKNAGTAAVRIISVTGQTVFSRSINTAQTTSLDLSHLPAGVYSISVATDASNGTARVVITH